MQCRNLYPSSSLISPRNSIDPPTPKKQTHFQDNRSDLNGDSVDKKIVLDTYEQFCQSRVPNLQRMNVFNYMLYRSPAIGPIGPLWQYLIGTGNAQFQGASKYTLENCAELLTRWDWGANDPVYIDAINLVSELLGGSAHQPLSKNIVAVVKIFSEVGINGAISTGKYKGRWSGLLRYYDDYLVFDAKKVDRDVLARRCDACGEWRMLRPDACKFPFCGFKHDIKKSQKVLYTS